MPNNLGKRTGCSAPKGVAMTTACLDRHSSAQRNWCHSYLVAVGYALPCASNLDHVRKPSLTFFIARLRVSGQIDNGIIRFLRLQSNFWVEFSFEIFEVFVDSVSSSATLSATKTPLLRMRDPRFGCRVPDFGSGQPCGIAEKVCKHSLVTILAKLCERRQNHCTSILTKFTERLIAKQVSSNKSGQRKSAHSRSHIEERKWFPPAGIGI